MEFLGLNLARDRRQLPGFGALLVPLLWLWAVQAPAQQPAREFRVKAAFLYNFAQFTEWPEEAFATTNAPLVIGILGEDPFGAAMDSTIRDETVRGHHLQVKRGRAVAEMTSCHIVYIGRSEANRLTQVLKALNGKAVLTVTDLEGAAERGVMIQFVTEHGRVRFKINPASARAAQLTLSSKLLRVADVVSSEKK